MKVCEKLMLYAQGELEGTDKNRFEAHLKECTSCQEELAFVRKMDESLFAPAAPASVGEELFSKTTRKKSFLAGWKPVFASTALLGVALFVTFIGLQPDKAAFDASEVIAYMSENLDEEYRTFAEDLAAFEEEF
jgi:anti-sigma factor RsiW